ncbi:hypothetical protein BS17DRAFT_779682 [Gyrodon lividus]|nr:hypothetical protein BS17DRAFT_779682 [Gyrodon lividus]
MHESTTDPYYADNKCRRWRRWHRQLEKREERRRTKKAYEFTACSEDLALVFLDELKIQRWTI